MKMFKVTAWVVATVCFSHAASAVSISEIQPNPTGADPAVVQLELSGVAFASFDGVFLSIESDSSSSVGTVDRVSTISGTFDANGLLVVDIDDLENPSMTMVLLDSFSGAVGTDIDTDNDGVADDLSSFGNVLDAIGVPDNVGDQSFIFGAQLGGADFAYTGDEPQLIFRDGVSGDWYAINDPAGMDAYDLQGSPVAFADFNQDPSVSTFGAVNPTTVVPVPGAIWLLTSALGMLALRSRKR